MEYHEIHEALKAQGLTWVTAAEAIGCSPQNLMGVAAGRNKSRPVAQRLALLLGAEITDVFPNIPAYAAPSRSEVNQAAVKAARQRLAAAGVPSLNVRSA